MKLSIFLLEEKQVIPIFSFRLYLIIEIIKIRYKIKKAVSFGAVTYNTDISLVWVISYAIKVTGKHRLRNADFYDYEETL